MTLRAATLTVRVRIVSKVFAKLFLVHIFFKIVMLLPDETVENVEFNSDKIKKRQMTAAFLNIRSHAMEGRRPPKQERLWELERLLDGGGY